MANRHTLHTRRLDDFKRWLRLDGWSIEEPKGDFEALRARKPGRKTPLIVYARLGNAGGGTLTHLTVMDRDEGVLRAYLKHSRQTAEKGNQDGM